MQFHLKAMIKLKINKNSQKDSSSIIEAIQYKVFIDSASKLLTIKESKENKLNCSKTLNNKLKYKQNSTTRRQARTRWINLPKK